MFDVGSPHSATDIFEVEFMVLVHPTSNIEHPTFNILSLLQVELK
jgi:hypothetical protein